MYIYNVFIYKFAFIYKYIKLYIKCMYIYIHIYNIFVCVHAQVPRCESEDILWESVLSFHPVSPGI